MLTIKAVIFDMGGVLVRTENTASRAALGLRFDKTYTEIDQIVFGSESSGRAARGEITARNHMQHVMHVLGLPETDEAIANFHAEFFAGDKVDYEMIEEIGTLRPKYKTALLSNAWDDLREMLINRWKIAYAFDELFISAEMRLAKPDPEIYKRVLAKLALPPEATVFVDDFIENIEAARQLGMHGIHFQEKEQAMGELRALLKKD